MNEIFRVSEPFIFTIFGASGDLAKLKIFPALFALAEQKRLPEEYWFIGYARTDLDQETFRSLFEESVRKHYDGTWGEYQTEILEHLLTRVHYFSGQYTDEKDFQKYKTFRDKLTGDPSMLQMYYFSIPPTVFEPVVRNVASIRKDKNDDVRLIMEKPFGEDECSARELFHRVVQYFDEKDIYLLDHYLGKKPVQSIIPLRHANRILSSMMKGQEVANIQISAMETVGVGKRVGYFDETGTLKDMVQSHLLQMLGLLTMSIPIEKNAANIQQEKAAILSSLNFPPSVKAVCLGQYEGYKDEHESVKDSNTATFVAMKLYINREEWYRVPIFLRTGKKLHERHTYMVVELKKFDFQPEDHEPNRIIIELAPEELISITLLDEGGVASQNVQMMTSHSIACQGDHCLPEHGLLLLDVIRGDKTYFLSFEEILASWKFVDHVQSYIEETNMPVESYPVGSQGPEGQDRVTEHKKFTWYDPHPEK